MAQLTKTVIGFLILQNALAGQLIHEVHENYVIDEPIIERLNTTSVQNCIQRCFINKLCLLASVKHPSSPTSGTECVLASRKCFESSYERISKKPGWTVYDIYAPGPWFLFAFNSFKNLCVERRVTDNKLIVDTGCSEMFCMEPEGLYHVHTRRCVGVQNLVTGASDALILQNACDGNSIFYEIEGPAVKQKSTGWCLHPHAQNMLRVRVVTWYSGCSYKFYFKYVR